MVTFNRGIFVQKPRNLPIWTRLQAGSHPQILLTSQEFGVAAVICLNINDIELPQGRRNKSLR
jgi:hypothetical protein